MTEFAKLLDRLYQGFFLRDILGFTVPGGIALIALRAVLDVRVEQHMFAFAKTTCAQLSTELVQSCQLSFVSWQMVLFIVMAYLTGWLLQSLHFVLVNLVDWARVLIVLLATIFVKFVLHKEVSDLCQSVNNKNVVEGADDLRCLLVSLIKKWLCKVREGCFSNFGEMSLEELGNAIKQQPLVTRGALEPDWIWAKCTDIELLKERLKDFPYNERLSALMLMSANLAMAIVVFVVVALVANNFNGQLLVGLLILIAALYIEYWRLWKARNLQMAIYANALAEKLKGATPVPKGHTTA